MTAPSSPSHTVARNTFFLFSAQTVVRLLGFVPVILLANYLGVEGYGVYSFAIAFAALFVPLCDLGIDTLLVREIAANPKERTPLARSALGTKLLLTLASIALIAAAAALQTPDRQRLEILVLAGIFIAFRTFPLTYGAFFRADQRMHIDALFTVSTKVLEVAAVIITMYAGLATRDLFFLLILSGLASTALAVALAHRTGFPTFPMFSQTSRTLLRKGLPFAFTAIAVTVNIQLGTVLLGYLLDERAVGLYRSSFNLVIAFGGFSSAISLALFPAVSQQYRINPPEAVRLTSRAIDMTLLVGLPVAVGGAVLAPHIILLLYSAEFAEAATTLRIIVWWIPIMFMTSVLGYVLAAINRQNVLLVVAIMNAAANVLFTIILVPFLQHNGAALAAVMTEALGFAVSSTVLLRRFGKIFSAGRIVRICFASAFLIPLAFLEQSVHVVILIAMGAVMYAGGLFALRLVTMADVSHALALLKSRS